jgi:hypothetical protein
VSTSGLQYGVGQNGAQTAVSSDGMPICSPDREHSRLHLLVRLNERAWGKFGSPLLEQSAHFVSEDGCAKDYATRTLWHLQEHAGTHFTYAYTGLDWPEEFETCQGERQSPISIPTQTAEAR